MDLYKNLHVCPLKRKKAFQCGKKKCLRDTFRENSLEKACAGDQGRQDCPHACRAWLLFYSDTNGVTVVEQTQIQLFLGFSCMSLNTDSFARTQADGH